MSNNNVIIAVPEEVLIVSLYHDYMIRHNLQNISVDDIRMSVKAFSDYILEYLSDLYGLNDTETNEEETDA